MSTLGVKKNGHSATGLGEQDVEATGCGLRWWSEVGEDVAVSSNTIRHNPGQKNFSINQSFI